VVEKFLELVATAEWFGLRETKERTVEKAAMTTVRVEIAELGSGLDEDPSAVAARSFDRTRFALEAMDIMVFSCWILTTFVLVCGQSSVL
jgi:hypothetical protein